MSAFLHELRRLFGELAGQDLAGAPGDASFFDLGFDSLFLSQASQALRKRFGVKITFRQMLEDLTTLDARAAYLAEKAPASAPPAAAMAPAPPVPAAAAASPIVASASGSLLEEIIRGQQR